MKDLCKFIVVFFGILTALSILSKKKPHKTLKKEKTKYNLINKKKINGSSIVKKTFVKNQNYKVNNDILPENDKPLLINDKDTYKNISNNTVNFNNSSPSPM
tara:strand:- start:24 stop:329 length:306 start_codon:yes stop_codon:yes gene_type:complete